MGPGDVITSCDNEGTWVPMCYLHIVKQGSFLSVPDLAQKEPAPTAFDPHVCFFPKSVDNSSGGQVWVTSDKWGPLKGRLLHLSYGTASLYHVMMEEVGGVVQGGVSKVPLAFDTGLMRGRFSPADGQLYLAGQRGWQTTGAEDGAIQRVRYTGKPHCAPNALRVTDRGIHIAFDEPLDPVTAGNADNYSIEQYNYRWTSNYGSKDYRPSNPEELGHDAVDITGVHLSEDRKSVFLQAAGLTPVMQSEITMRVKAASGEAMPEKIWHTINAVGRETGPVLELASANKIPAPKTAGSGVGLTLRAGGGMDVRKDRLVAIHVPEGTNVSPLLPKGRFNAEWRSVLAVPLRKQVTLMAEGTGNVKVSVNDTPLFEGYLSESGKRLEGNLELRKGGNLLKVEYNSPEKGDATFRLLWSSGEFAPEPVQPTALYLPADLAEPVGKFNEWREGRTLFAQSNCVACHDGAGVLAPKGQAAAAMPELSRGAPMLADIGARFNQDWVTKWIQNPHQYREHSRMPAVFHGATSAQQSADIAAFLATQGTPAAELTLDNATAGGALFANLGCIACHSTPSSKVGNNFSRVSLNHVSSKWKAAALNEFIQDPLKYHAGTAMPKTPMSEKEALQVTAFLMSFPKEQSGNVPTGDMAKGAQLLTTVGCLQCHAGVPGTAAPLQKLAGKESSSGCLGDTAEKRGNAPDYQFGKEQRVALQTFLKKAPKEGVQTVENDSALEFAKRAVTDLRCVACHQLDARQSVWSSVTEEANMIGGLKAPKRDPKKPEHAHLPIPTTSIPNLTWLGEKLQPSWSAKMIAGQLSEKTRPYVFGRMPAFPAYAEQLAKGLSHWHGFSEKPAAFGSASSDLAATGHVLLGDQGGFACTVCHAVGKNPATAPFEAPALNLALVSQRLRLSYYDRWLLNPQRVDPDTKMPRYSDGQVKTQLKQVLEGDGVKQFDAIRQYLISIAE
jgi:cytochrome c2